jgi:hypothetical protein
MTPLSVRLGGTARTASTARLDGVARSIGATRLNGVSTVPAELLALPLVPWEGSNAEMWAGNPSAAAMGLTDPGHFPVMSYLGYSEAPYAAQAKAAGITGFFAMVDNTRFDLPPQLVQQGMYAFPQWEEGVSLSPLWNAPTDHVIGHFLADELDMRSGPGWGAGQGYADSATIYATIPAASRTARHVAANYGKGVLMWETDAEAAVFVNGGSSGAQTFTQKIVGFDLYYYSDTNVAAEALNFLAIPNKAQVRRAINYGRHGVRRIRHLQHAFGAPLRPIVAHVEAVTQSGLDPERTNPDTVLPAEFTAAHIEGAVWASIIYGARAISYFGHDAAGWGYGSRVIEDNAQGYTPAITALNARVTALAPVINTQTRAWGVNGGLDTMLKVHGGYGYIFAMQGRSDVTSGSYEHALPPGVPAGQTVTVLNESRTVTATGGRFTDTYAAEHTCHVYRFALNGAGATVSAGATTPNGTTGGLNQGSSATGAQYVGAP